MPEKELVIRIEGLSASRKEKNKEALNSATDPKNSSKDSKKDNKDKEEKSVKGIAGTLLINQAKTLSSNLLHATVGTIGAREDNIAKQNSIQNMLSTGEQVVNTVDSAITAYAAANAMVAGAGPIAMAITATAELAKQAINIANNLQDYWRDQARENANSQMQLNRLGNVTTNRNR